jgi:hypothetical protein
MSKKIKHLNCQEFIIQCTKCQNLFCKKHEKSIEVIHKLTNEEPFSIYFCSGKCLAVFNLQQLALFNPIYQDLDISWEPVLLNLIKELENKNNV